MGSVPLMVHMYETAINRHKPLQPSTNWYIPPCTTGQDPSKFGFSEECSGYTKQWNVYHEHSSEKPNSIGSRLVVQGGIYSVVLGCTGLCLFMAVSYHSKVYTAMKLCSPYHNSDTTEYIYFMV